MVRPREITIEQLNDEVSLKDVKVVERDVNPNYAHIVFKECGHTKKVGIKSLRRNTPFCEVCYENELALRLHSLGFKLLTKLSGGSRYATKTQSSQRLVSCNYCGYWKLVVPNNSQNWKLQCRSCQRTQAESHIPEEFLLINKVDRSYVKLAHMFCGNSFTYQLSNLKRHSPKCPFCGKNIKNSFVYLIRLSIPNYPSIVKVGKSNNPYLRILDLTTGKCEIKFICAIEFESESKAFAFEKSIHNKFNDHNLPPQECKKYLRNGFTECYPVSLLEEIRKEFKHDKTLVHL